MNTLPHLDYETDLWNKGFIVIGIDEVGRGAFAGPVTVGGVVFEPTANKKRLTELLSYGINDSKKLKASDRELLSKIIQDECLAFHIGTIGVAQINRFGIGKATFSAMRTVVKNLTLSLRVNKVKRSNLKEIAASSTTPRDDKLFVLVDAFTIKHLPGIGRKNQKGIIHGDAISLSIAAASVIAKVYQDNHMRDLSAKFPLYGWEQNKGYGTLDHRNALKQFGKTRLHRKDFIENFI